MQVKEKLIQRFSYQNKVYPVVRTTFPSNFETLFAFKSTYETQTSKEDQVFDKLPEKYHTIDSCEFSNRGITSVTTLDDIVTPLNGKSKSIEVAALVHEPVVMTKDPVFDAMSYKTASPDFHDPNASVLDVVQSSLVIAKVTDKSICGNDSLHLEATIQADSNSSSGVWDPGQP
ncbi:hypothetical protein KY285_035646 [Solanum tuberosum]|nr:hypothetical protein KY289_035879 [Solanum tuberosum]KAH0639060.1 hypothetical protein KY285_035646 [Solanum tuberosum]